MSLRLISLNIERAKHYDLVLPFLKAQTPDIVCLQEMLERDIPLFKEALGMDAVYAPMDWYPAEEKPALMGIAIFSRFPIRDSRILYYAGNPQNISPTQAQRTVNNFALLVADVEQSGSLYRIGTTHFLWTFDGSVSSEQREAFAKLLPLLEAEREIVFCGDFNAPRGGEIFSMLAKKYTDNVPSQYTTSIDGSLHRAGPLQHMVDGLFSTPAYQVSQVRMVCGVSDHCALVGEIQKVSTSPLSSSF